MPSHNHVIERLPLPPSETDLRDLARVLVDAVEANAAVSFVAPLTVDRAVAWWRKTVAEAGERAVFLVPPRQGDAAEQLYRRTGWTELGIIPRYAFDPDGTPHGAVFFYKELVST